MKRGAQDYLIKEQLTPELLHYAITNAIEKMSMSRQMEEQRLELARQHRAFQMLAENAPDIIARFDSDLRYLYVNPAITQATGFAAESFVGKSNREAGMPEDLCTIWDECLREVFATGQFKQLDYIFPSPSGERFYQSRLAPEFNAERQVISVLNISRDVTDLKRTEMALRESEARLRMAFSVAKMGTWDWDISTGNLRWSEEHETILGLPAGTFGGTYDAFLALVYPDDVANIAKKIQQALDQHTEYQIDFRMYGADDKLHWTTGRGKAPIMMSVVPHACLVLYRILQNINWQSNRPSSMQMILMSLLMRSMIASSSLMRMERCYG
ncbi:PAS domain-containing protein [Dictyobacter vulcani]|nr:PAS domain-containing protein [Dictyobacter vulcani]